MPSRPTFSPLATVWKIESALLQGSEGQQAPGFNPYSQRASESITNSCYSQNAKEIPVVAQTSCLNSPVTKCNTIETKCSQQSMYVYAHIHSANLLFSPKKRGLVLENIFTKIFL